MLYLRVKLLNIRDRRTCVNIIHHAVWVFFSFAKKENQFTKQTESDWFLERCVSVEIPNFHVFVCKHEQNEISNFTMKMVTVKLNYKTQFN